MKVAHHQVSCTACNLFEPIDYVCNEDCGTLFSCIGTLVAEGMEKLVSYPVKLKTHVIFSFQWLNKTALRADKHAGTIQPLMA